jgi:hypothetical protein
MPSARGPSGASYFDCGLRGVQFRAARPRKYGGFDRSHHNFVGGSARFTNSVRLRHVCRRNGPKCCARRIHRQYVGASFRFVFASLCCPVAKAFGPYLIRAARRGLSNAAKDLLLVANLSTRSCGTELLRHAHFNWATRPARNVRLGHTRLT